MIAPEYSGRTNGCGFFEFSFMRDTDQRTSGYHNPFSPMSLNQLLQASFGS